MWLHFLESLLHPKKWLQIFQFSEILFQMSLHTGVYFNIVPKQMFTESLWFFIFLHFFHLCQVTKFSSSCVSSWCACVRVCVTTTNREECIKKRHTNGLIIHQNLCVGGNIIHLKYSSLLTHSWRCYWRHEFSFIFGNKTRIFLAFIRKAKTDVRTRLLKYTQSSHKHLCNICCSGLRLVNSNVNTN